MASSVGCEQDLSRDLSQKTYHLEISRLEISASWASLALHLLQATDSTKKAFLSLSWPHLGLHLEISRLEISPRKLS